MTIQVKIKERTTVVKIIERKDNLLKVEVDGKQYDVDLIKVEPGVYSALINGDSFDIDLSIGEDGKKYSISTYLGTTEVEIIDPQTRYRESRKGTNYQGNENKIVSPMPGKVVKILVNEGDTVVVGQTVLIISAMKMESEFKSQIAGVVKKIYALEGETVEGNKVLMIIE